MTEQTTKNVAGVGRIDDAGNSTDLTTTYEYSNQGEVKCITFPLGNQACWEYVDSPNNSQVGNLLVTGTKDGGGQFTSRTRREYRPDFNLVKAERTGAYRDCGRGGWTQSREYSYYPNGNLETISEPTCGGSSYIRCRYTYTPEGLPETSREKTDHTDKRVAYHYYAACDQHVPGDAHDAAGRLAIIHQVPMGYRPPAKLYLDKFGTWAENASRARSSQPAIATGDVPQDRDMVTSIRPDVLGNPVETFNAKMHRFLLTFNEVGQILTDQATQTQFTYDMNGQQVKAVVPARSRSLANGLGEGTRQPQESRFAYDSLGNVVAILRKEGDDAKTGKEGESKLSSVARYNVWGQPLEAIDETGRRRKCNYDERGLLVNEEYSDGSRTIVNRNAYDANGNLIVCLDPSGWAEGWYYDDTGRLTRTLAKTGLVTEMEYGPGGAVLRETTWDPAGLSAERQRCAAALGNQAQKKTLTPIAMDTLKTLVRDLAVRGLRDATRGTVLSDVTYWRDCRGNVSKESWLRVVGGKTPLGSAGSRVDIMHAWHDDDAPKASTCLKQNLSAYTYDFLGRVTNIEAGEQWESYRHDALGNVVEKKGADGTTSITYDRFNCPIKQTHRETGKVLQEAVYDPTGLVLAQYTHPNTVVSFQYGGLGRWLQRSTRYGNGRWPLVSSRRYDEDTGELESESLQPVAEGVQPIEVTYEQRGMFGPQAIKTKQGGQTIAVESAIEYDESGNKVSWVDANGAKHVVAYDGSGNPANLIVNAAGGQLMATRTIVRDAAGRPLVLADDEQNVFASAAGERALMYSMPVSGNTSVSVVPSDHPGPVVSSFTYDSLGNLCQEVQQAGAFPARTLSSTYDRPGQRQSLTYPVSGVNPRTVSCAYDSSGRPTGMTWAGGLAGALMSVIGNDRTYAKPANTLKNLSLAGLVQGQLAAQLVGKWDPAVSSATVTLGPCLGAGRPINPRVSQAGTRHERTFFNYWQYGLTADKRMTDKTTRVAVNATVNAEKSATGYKPKAEQITVLDTLQGLPDGLGNVLLTGVDSHLTTLVGGRPAVQGVTSETSSRVSRGTESWGRISEVDSSEHITSTRKWGPEEVYSYDVKSLAHNAYTDRRAPLGEPWTVSDVSYRRNRSTTLIRDNAGRTYAEPNITLRRNVFGQPVQVTTVQDQRPQICTMRYDALGRLVLKELPADIRIGDDTDAQAVIIQVGHCDSPSVKPHFAVNSFDQVVAELRARKGLKTIAVRLAQGQKVTAAQWQKVFAVLNDDLKNAYERIVFEANDRTLPVTLDGAGMEMDAVHNVTFRRIKFGGVTLRDCRGVTFDACDIMAVVGRGQCDGLQVQNSVLRLPDGFAIELTVYNSSILIAHNRFAGNPSGTSEPIAIHIDYKTAVDRQKEITPWLRYGVLNNLFQHKGPGSMGSLVRMDSIGGDIGKCAPGLGTCELQRGCRGTHSGRQHRRRADIRWNQRWYADVLRHGGLAGGGEQSRTRVAGCGWAVAARQVSDHRAAGTRPAGGVSEDHATLPSRRGAGGPARDLLAQQQRQVEPIAM